MKRYIEDRVRQTARYIARTGATVREAARVFRISKSTVHKDMCERLPQLDRGLYRQVRDILEENLAQRHIRGGLATQRKYRGSDLEKEGAAAAKNNIEK